MNREFVKLGLVGLLIVIVCNANAQSFKETLDSLRSVYADVKDLHVIMNVAVNSDSVSNLVFYSDRIDIKKKGDAFRVSMKDQELLLNEKYLVVVNKASKELMFTTRNEKSEKLLRNRMNINIDSLYKVLGNPQFISRQGDSDHYLLKHQKGEIRKTDFFLNKKKGFLERIVYHYREGQKAVIEFSTFNFEPVFAQDTFDENNFLTFDVKGKAKPIAAFSKYIILNNEE
jgi:outer membrane lipoprotein-sorting protein